MYRLTENECIQRVSDGAFIPPDPENRDYSEYQAWVSAGNVPAPYVPPAVATVTKREALVAALSSALELSQDEVKALFAEAAKL